MIEEKFQLDINQIIKLMPYRYPFVLLDKIIEIIPRIKAVGVKNVTVNEPFFQGHFPEKPIMPGVLIIESIAQVTVVLYKFRNSLVPDVNYDIILGSVKARLFHPVYPGDQMIIEVIAEKFISTGGISRGNCTVNGNKVCVADIGFAAKEISS
jgi:3-hydroxyacyl-[acyl-carrier-protein] dehydratase